MSNDGKETQPGNSPACVDILTPTAMQQSNDSRFIKAVLRHHFYITIPWSPYIFVTLRGAENVHLYLWIAKDLAWSQDNYWLALIFGITTLSWCIMLVYHAAASRCINEIYMLIPLIMWLSANFIWMYGKTPVVTLYSSVI